MIKKFNLLILIIILTKACSFDTKSGLWTSNEDFKKETISDKKTKVLFLVKLKKFVFKKKLAG